MRACACRKLLCFHCWGWDRAHWTTPLRVWLNLAAIIILTPLAVRFHDQGWEIGVYAAVLAVFGLWWAWYAVTTIAIKGFY